MEAPKELYDLDEIMQLCRWRFSNHYQNNEWENLAKKIGRSDTDYLFNPYWIALLTELEKQKLIIPEPLNQYSVIGYIATIKGLIHSGFVNEYNNSVAESIRVKMLEDADVRFSESQIKLNEKLNRLTFWLVFFAALTICWTIYKDVHEMNDKYHWWY